jgi:alcohol dehydrogenase (cytochrome c)
MRFFALALILTASLSAQDDGAKVFASRCGACHGADGGGGERGPRILNDRGDLAKLVREGANAMPALELSPSEMTAVAEFVKDWISARKNDQPAQVFPKLNGPSRDWSTYHGQFSGNRDSPLKLINTGNIGSLAPRWIFNIPTQARHENTPIVVGGVMYVTAVNEVFALDARNGHQLWHYQQPRSKGLVGDAAGGINRGVAILENRLFLGTDNAHLIALDRFTGHLLWDSEMADSREHYGSTSAPLVVHDLVVMGASGGDEGARGFLNAYNPSTGERVWRFWTLPAAGEPLADTWRGSAIQHGCATTWFTGTYDAELDIL